MNESINQSLFSQCTVTQVK